MQIRGLCERSCCDVSHCQGLKAWFLFFYSTLLEVTELPGCAIIEREALRYISSQPSSLIRKRLSSRRAEGWTKI